MPWAKKYPGLAGVIGAPGAGGAGPSIAPVGEAQPAMANRSMGVDLRPQSVPNTMPATPMLRAQPDFSKAIKNRALSNIARGRSGF